VVRRRSSAVLLEFETKEHVETPPDLANLAACIEDARVAALDGDRGPEDPTGYAQLRGRLEASRDKLPPLYRESFFKPYGATLDRLGSTGFTDILIRDPPREGAAGLMLDMAHVILQNGEGYADRATDAFQEVVSDLYDGLLSAEDRSGVKPPDHGVIPPLVKWGNPQFGPYTWPVDATSSFGATVGLVNLPPANARRGLLAWGALGHETAGHDILHADEGLEQEIAGAVRTALENSNLGRGLPGYWSERIDETASDVLGVLNMGPAAGIALVAYFRGLNAAFGGAAKLRNDGPASDPHPADIVRGWLAAATVRRLSFGSASRWADAIDQQTDADAGRIRLAGLEIPREEARRSADIVAETIVHGRMKSLEGHALGQIQDWCDRDERIVRRLRVLLATAKPLPTSYLGGIYAAHVVAAAITAALASGADLAVVFERMSTVLKAMHDANPSWGPLFVTHPGNLAPHYAYRELGED